MATGRVRAGFFETRTRPAGLLLLPGPDPFNKRVFFLAPYPARRVSVGPAGPVQPATSGPNPWPNLIYIYIYI